MVPLLKWCGLYPDHRNEKARGGEVLERNKKELNQKDEYKLEN